MQVLTELKNLTIVLFLTLQMVKAIQIWSLYINISNIAWLFCLLVVDSRINQF